MIRNVTLVAGLALAGCGATRQQAEKPPEVDAPAIANYEAETQRTLKRVAEAKRALYSVLAGERRPIPDDLRAPIRWTWRGPLDRGAMHVAQTIGYKFVGPPPGPALPEVHVNTGEAGTPAVDVLRAFHDQAGGAVNFNVDPVEQTITVFRP